MRKRVCMLAIAALGILLTACGTKETKKSTTASSSNASLCFTDQDPGAELTDYEGLWKSGEGEQDYDFNYLYVYRATEKYLWFTYTNTSTDAIYMRAEKKKDGKYHFYFGTKASGHSYAISEGDSGEEGTFSLHDGIITDTIHYSEWSQKTTNDYQFVEKIDKEIKMDVLAYLDDYHKAYACYEDNKLNYRYLGMDKASDKVSYFYHGEAGYELPYKYPFDYSFGNITISSTKTDCDKTWGNPIRIKKSKKGYICIYQYKDYQISIYFSQAGSIYDMTLFLKSRGYALATYKSGDFTMRGNQIVKYINQSADEVTVTFPKNAVAIESEAFKKSESTLQMVIPAKMNLNFGAFTNISHANITFEEGRTKIPRYAFCSMAYYSTEKDEESSISVTLPNSIRILEEGSFSNYNQGEKIHLKLNDGLEEIGDSAIRGLTVDFPDSVRKIGNDAILWSMYGGVCKKELILPAHLEEMGDNCIEFEEETDGEGDEDPEVPVVKIPASVKKMGKNVVIGGEYIGGPK